MNVCPFVTVHCLKKVITVLKLTRFLSAIIFVNLAKGIPQSQLADDTFVYLDTWCNSHKLCIQMDMPMDVRPSLVSFTAVFWAVTQRSPKKERLLTSEPHSFPIVFAACLRAIEQANQSVESANDVSFRVLITRKD